MIESVMIKNIVSLVSAAAMVAGFAVAAPVLAQASAPTHADTGLPFCSKTVTDRCIQRVDLVREGKSTARK